MAHRIYSGKTSVKESTSDKSPKPDTEHSVDRAGDKEAGHGSRASGFEAPPGPSGEGHKYQTPEKEVGLNRGKAELTSGPTKSKLSPKEVSNLLEKFEGLLQSGKAHSATLPKVPSISPVVGLKVDVEPPNDVVPDAAASGYVATKSSFLSSVHPAEKRPDVRQQATAVDDVDDGVSTSDDSCALVIDLSRDDSYLDAGDDVDDISAPVLPLVEEKSESDAFAETSQVSAAGSGSSCVEKSQSAEPPADQDTLDGNDADVDDDDVLVIDCSQDSQVLKFQLSQPFLSLTANLLNTSFINPGQRRVA